MRIFFFGVLLSLLIPFGAFGPTPNPGDPFIIISKRTNELAYYEDNQVVLRAPAATGVNAEDTPEGVFMIVVKAENPYDRRRDIEGGDPRNPLGSRWIGFDARHTDGRIYGIHGNSNPDSIGKKVTNGCIRLHEQDIQALFASVPYGTKVLITNEDRPIEELALSYLNRQTPNTMHKKALP
ncbi:L,D-transpeptidase [Aureibacillus halotolerans]|uniref:L,D-transpeptidase-like protein n=1 Tax=Aureibacillus halotolerans TaxID=1508390 RepID=A0A4R6UAB7_9BACI|nr:L,D-transpeptidase [Aureibacillus halotolerans]TDQ41625.1 L,D-transpeptidase-like protein [Aureibacillus halotolerans]